VVAFACRVTTGGLRLLAPGCTHAYPRRCAVAIRNGVLFHASIAVRTSGGEKTIFAMHKRTSGSGAAGVSPPWVGKCASADMTAIRRQTAGSVCADRRYIRVDSCHGGLTPPALVLVYERLPTKKRFLRCTDACSPKSGGREPAVGVSIALAKALPQSRRRPPALCSRTPVQCRSFTTAGLRQPLLVARGLFAAKCTLRNAESHMQQERRA
jgi:hypothetical protein